MYDIVYNESCLKFLKKLQKIDQKRIIEKIGLLSSNPLASYSKKIVGIKGNLFRLRVGDYRVLYLIDNKDKKIIISKIDKRERIY